MKVSKLRDSNNYKSFGIYLTRNKIESSYSVASLLIEKFAQTKRPSEWQCITAEDVKQKNILPSEKNPTFGHWRDEMIRNRFLICMATREELKEKTPNHKGNMFKIGDRLRKYIDQAIQESLPSKVEDLSVKFDEFDNKVIKLEEKNIQLEENIKNLDDKMAKVYRLLLKALPPDTEERRQIIDEFIHDEEICFQKLNEETRQKNKHN